MAGVAAVTRAERFGVERFGVEGGYFRDYDVLLCPVTPMTATPHGVQELVIDGVTVPCIHVKDIRRYSISLACLRFR